MALCLSAWTNAGLNKKSSLQGSETRCTRSSHRKNSISSNALLPQTTQVPLYQLSLKASLPTFTSASIFACNAAYLRQQTIVMIIAEPLQLLYGFVSCKSCRAAMWTSGPVGCFHALLAPSGFTTVLHGLTIRGRSFWRGYFCARCWGRLLCARIILRLFRHNCLHGATPPSRFWVHAICIVENEYVTADAIRGRQSIKDAPCQLAVCPRFSN